MNKYTKEILTSIVLNSKCVSDVIRKLGLKLSGGNHSHISKKIKEFDIDCSHFVRSANHAGGNRKLHWSEILILKTKNRREEAFKLRRALLEYGRNHNCEKCGTGEEWLGERLCLQIDHINGNWLDNTPENLRFLCPNCHSQTKTFGIRKIASVA